MTTARLEADLLTFVRHLLRRHGVEADVGPETLLFEEGYLNSLRILDLIAFLEKALGRKIPDRDVKLATFRSIRVIAQRLASSHVDGSGDDSDTIFSHRTGRPLAGSPIDGLRNDGLLTLFGIGQVGLNGAPLRMLEYFDGVALDWARELGAVEHQYPNLIAFDTLRRAGYVEAFPHHLALVSPAHVVSGEPQPGTTEASTPGLSYALSPAVCFHCYAQWQGRLLPANPIVITARGRCCRFEKDRLSPLERQRDFTMREIIMFGSRDEVESIRQHLIRRAEQLVAALDLDGSIESATDPFYGPLSDGQRLRQRAGALKYELRLTLQNDGHAVAVASFNHHEDHFGRAFDIRLPNDTLAHSGCVALGLERWVLAVFTQYGADERDWPAVMQSSSAGARA